MGKVIEVYRNTTGIIILLCLHFKSLDYKYKEIILKF